MKKYQLLARGKNLLGQLGIPKATHVEDYTPVDALAGKMIKQIAINLGQTFVLTDDGNIIREAVPHGLGLRWRLYRSRA